MKQKNIIFNIPSQTYPNVRVGNICYGSFHSKNNNWSIMRDRELAAAAAAGCGGGSWICKNSPLYSDILCFVHILIEHYWKYNNKNNPDIKLSYKAKPIFALKLQQSKEFFLKLEPANWTEVSQLKTNNSSSIPMKPNEAKFFQDSIYSTRLRNEQWRRSLSHTERLTRLDLFFNLFGK